MFILQLCRSTIILLQSMFSQIQFHNLSHSANSRLTSPAILDLFKLSKRKIIHTKTTTVFYALLDEEGEVNSLRAIKFSNISKTYFFSRKLNSPIILYPIFSSRCFNSIQDTLSIIFKSNIQKLVKIFL